VTLKQRNDITALSNADVAEDYARRGQPKNNEETLTELDRGAATLDG